jgi:cell wall-associated NlpC family hydrolase
MNPFQLIGLPYRLGADPEKHKAADCLTLAKAVLKHYDIKSPCPTRDWYRRLKKEDYSIFREQLELWGIRTESLKIGTVGLCKSTSGYGLAVYFENGWLNITSYEGSAVTWNPIGVLQVEEYYYPQKSNFVKS